MVEIFDQAFFFFFFWRGGEGAGWCLSDTLLKTYNRERGERERGRQDRQSVYLYTDCERSERKREGERGRLAREERGGHSI